MPLRRRDGTSEAPCDTRRQESHLPSDFLIRVFIKQALPFIHVILINAWKGSRIMEQKSKVIVPENRWRDDTWFAVAVFHD